MLARGVLTFAFFGTDAFVPLVIQDVRHESVTYTGIVLTVSTLSWTAASWVQQHSCTGSGPRFFVRLGFALHRVGIAGVAALALGVGPGLDGRGDVEHRRRRDGLGYSPLSLVMLDAAEPGREGAASAVAAALGPARLRARHRGRGRGGRAR